MSEPRTRLPDEDLAFNEFWAEWNRQVAGTPWEVPSTGEAFRAGYRAAAVRVPVPGESEAREAEEGLIADAYQLIDWYAEHPESYPENRRRLTNEWLADFDAWRERTLASRPSVREAQEGEAEAARNRLHAAADAIRAVQREAQEGTP